MNNMEDELYRAYILELYHEPLHAGKIDTATAHIHETNPTCGDELDLYLHTEEETLRNASHESTGCAISIAATSLLLDDIIGKKKEEIQQMTPQDVYALLNIPISHTREKCATLALRAVQKNYELRN